MTNPRNDAPWCLLLFVVAFAALGALGKWNTNQLEVWRYEHRSGR